MIYERQDLIDKGVVFLVHYSDVDLTPECREWLNDHFERSVWWWDYFVEEHEVGIYFRNTNDAMLFKLRWL